MLIHLSLVALAHVSEGKRALKTQRFIQELVSTNLGQQLVIFNILEEALRFLTFQFLSFGDPGSVRPTLCLFANLESSPLTAVIQYLTSLLILDADRLVLLYAREGFDSVSA